jgi:hypothetical protein
MDEGEGQQELGSSKSRVYRLYNWETSEDEDDDEDDWGVLRGWSLGFS